MSEPSQIDPTRLLERAAEGHKFCESRRIVFEKQLEKVDSHSVHLQAVDTFYRVTKDETNEGRAEKYKMLKTDAEETKKMCWHVCMEAINRDFIAYIRTGEYGNVSNEVYEALLDE